jgi:thioredoxin-related protein
MKRICLIFVSLLVLYNVTKAQTPTTDAVLKPVYVKAGKENKKVLLIFHASWCGWCRKMDAALADTSIKKSINSNYEIAHLTVYESKDKTALENPGALDLLTKLGGADKGLPYWFVLDADGKKLADSQSQPGKNTGCPASAEEVAYFISVLRATSLLKDEELQKVAVRFRKNEQ